MTRNANRISTTIDRFFIGLADALGTNTTIAMFAVIAFVPLCYQLPKTVIEWQNWLSQTCIQLIALAILQKGTKIEGARTYKILAETHDTVMTELNLIKKLCVGCAYGKNAERL